MFTFFTLIIGAVICGFLTWRSERRRIPDRAVRRGIGTAIQLLCMVGLGAAGEHIASPDHPTRGFIVGMLVGAVIAIILQNLFDWGPRVRRRS
jgi:multisubunit Na+/H+ antiporter MnhE subunit